MNAIDPNLRLNLTKAKVLLVEGSQHASDVMAQILKGFGVAEVHRAIEADAAEKTLRNKAFDLIVINPNVSGGAGYGIIHALRHSGGPNAYIPVIVVSGHVRARDVARARDTGANYFVTKPITPTTLLQRILFVARDKRPFVEVGSYIGPDRRFKYEGPPAASDGRRTSDLKAPLASPSEPNMSQDEIEQMIKPQRVMI